MLDQVHCRLHSSGLKDHSVSYFRAAHYHHINQLAAFEATVQ